MIWGSHHGFRMGKSCLSSDTLCNAVSSSVDAGRAADVVYLDSSKAFKTLTHKSLREAAEVQVR